jgi:hypothetical protein
MGLVVVLYPVVESEVFLPCLVCFIRPRRSPLGVGFLTCAFALVSDLAKFFSFSASVSSWFPRFVDFGFGNSSSRSSSGVLFVLLVFCHHFSYWFSPFRHFDLGLAVGYPVSLASPGRRRRRCVCSLGVLAAVVLSALERLGSAPGLHRLCVPSMGMLWSAVFGA